MYDNADEINNKPVDLLILFHAIVGHLACILMVTFISIGMIFEFTFASYFGETWCLLPWYAFLNLCLLFTGNNALSAIPF